MTSEPFFASKKSEHKCRFFRSIAIVQEGNGQKDKRFCVPINEQALKRKIERMGADFVVLSSQPTGVYIIHDLG